MTGSDGGVQGDVKPGFEGVRDAFAVERPGVNAALAVHVHGERVIDLWRGPDQREDSIVAVYSATKGASAMVLAVLVDRGLIDPDAPVARYWPEFAAAGKGDVTVRVLASHQAGLVNVDGGFEYGELLAHAPLAERLAAQAPLWEPGTAHGYHALTIGTLLDELVRRVTGAPLGEVFRREIAEPYGVDFFIGLPEEQEPRIVPVKPLGGGGGNGGGDGGSNGGGDGGGNGGDGGGDGGAPPAALPPFFLRTMNIDPRSGRTGPSGDLPGMRAFRAAGVPSIGGFGSARGLAALYAAALPGDRPGGRGPLIGAETLRTVTAVQASGEDVALPFDTSFALTFQSPTGYAGPSSFGHEGAAGALGFADPARGVAYGYVTDTPTGAGGDPLNGALVAALREALQA